MSDDADKKSDPVASVTPETRRHEWQPIETAPKDGTQIQVWIPLACSENGGFITHVSYIDWQGDIPNVTYQGKPHHDGWCDTFSGDYVEEAPTHWMSLPDPPQSSLSPVSEATQIEHDDDKDDGASLLPVDASAAVQTEPLPICGRCGHAIQHDEPRVGRDCKSQQYHLRDCRG